MSTPAAKTSTDAARNTYATTKSIGVVHMPLVNVRGRMPLVNVTSDVAPEFADDDIWRTATTYDVY